MASKPPTRPLQKTDAAHGNYVVSREGLYAIPKTMFDLFFKAVGTFFVGGHEALPCWVRTYDQWLEMYVEIMRDKELTCIVEH